MGMGKLIYSMNVSLDGFVETPDHSLEWADVDEELHAWFNDLARESAASIYGRRMYEVMSSYWPTAGSDPNATPVEREYAAIWAEQPKIVFSRTLDAVGFGCRLVKGDIGDELAKLRQEFDGDIDVERPRHRGAVHRARPRRRVRPRRPPGGHRRRHAVLPQAHVADQAAPDRDQALRVRRHRPDLRGRLTPATRRRLTASRTRAARPGRGSGWTACAG